MPDSALERMRGVGEFIRAQRESARMSLRRLSEVAGISNPYLSQIERGLRKPSAEILQAIARGLEISSETLYVQAGILDERSAPHTGVIEAIREDERLSDAQKAAMIELYRNFVSVEA